MTTASSIALDRLSQIIDPDVAVADKALATSLQQINGITTMSLNQLATTASALVTTANLPLVSAQTNAVSSTTANTIINTVGTGTGPNGTITMYDLLGTATGINATNFTNVVSAINTMNLTDLQDTYQTMLDVVNGTYGDPIAGPVIIPSGPYANTYTDANDAFGNALIAGAQTNIATAVSTYPTQVATLNTNWNTIAAQLVLEKNNQASAKIDFTQLEPNDTQILYSFITSLPTYGTNYVEGGTQDFLQNTADLSNLTGQSIVAVMRQGQNQTAMNAVGIGSNLNIPDTPNPPPPTANLIPGN